MSDGRLETFSVTQAGRDPRKIHSSYNPEKEAERYVASLRLDSSIECFILLECGLCYVIPFLQKINSKAKIINIHLSDEYLSKNAPPRNLKTAEWSPSSRERLSDFLENEMPDIESGTIKIIEWRPALKIFGGQYLAVLKETAAFIQRRCANKRTVLYFKERWERNTKKNIHLIQKNTGKSRRIDSTFFSPLDTIKKNIVVCASGPLLEDDIALIQEEQSGGECEIIAVSSALGALYARNIIPDIAITSDGGNWARFHLYEIMRLSKKPVVLASLNAALLSDFSALPLYLFSDGSAEQNALLQNSSRLCFALPARGTVSANAIDFAIMRTKGNIYITGLDLKNNDIASHARPYAFDIFLWEGANRFKPAYSLHYKRTKDAENGKTYTIYRDWFKNETAKYPPRIFFLSNKKTKWGVR